MATGPHGGWEGHGDEAKDDIVAIHRACESREPNYAEGRDEGVYSCAQVDADDENSNSVSQSVSDLESCQSYRPSNERYGYEEHRSDLARQSDVGDNGEPLLDAVNEDKQRTICSETDMDSSLCLSCGPETGNMGLPPKFADRRGDQRRNRRRSFLFGNGNSAKEPDDDISHCASPPAGRPRSLLFGRGGFSDEQDRTRQGRRRSFFGSSGKSCDDTVVSEGRSSPYCRTPRQRLYVAASHQIGACP